jgi:hypothetical protein
LTVGGLSEEEGHSQTLQQPQHRLDERPRRLSVERGCALMGMPRSTYYAAPEARLSDDEPRTPS